LNDNWFDNEKEKYLQVCVGYFSEQRLPSVWRATVATSFFFESTKRIRESKYRLSSVDPKVEMVTILL